MARLIPIVASFLFLTPIGVLADSMGIKVNAASLIVVAKAEQIRVFSSHVHGASGWGETKTDTLTESSDLEPFVDLVVSEVLYPAGIAVPRTLKVSLKGAYFLVQKLHGDLGGKELIYYLQESKGKHRFDGYLKRDEPVYVLPGQHWAFKPDGIGRRQAVSAVVAAWHTGGMKIPIPYRESHALWRSAGTTAAADGICQVTRTADPKDTFAYIEALHVLDASEMWLSVSGQLHHRPLVEFQAHVEMANGGAPASARIDSTLQILECLTAVGEEGPPETQYALANFWRFRKPAARLLEKSAGRGFVSAQFRLARAAFSIGRIEADKEHPPMDRLDYMVRAADGGDSRAAYEAACAYSTVDCGPDHAQFRFSAFRKVLAPDAGRASQWLATAVNRELEVPDFAFDSNPMVGGQAISDRMVIYLDRRNISLRNNMRVMLGQMHEAGAGVPLDSERAFQLYLDAAMEGDAAGASHVSRCYESGIGVVASSSASLRWKRIARRLGLGFAEEILLE